MENYYLYYNIYSNSTDVFLGTIAVEIRPEWKAPPYDRACHIACNILGNEAPPGGIWAVVSTKEVFNTHGLNKKVI